MTGSGRGGAALARTSGAVLFARYAYPPNALGYCGPDRARELLKQAALGGRADDDGLRHLAAGFAGAWPYLGLIAGASGIADSLDLQVVEAYWIGNALLDNVTPSVMDRFLAGRSVGRRAGVGPGLVDTVPTGAVPAGAVPAAAVPHHCFHVFGVSPWLGLLRSGHLAEPLHVLDQCRIRWGRVIEVGSGFATVRSRPLVWDLDGHYLRLGEPRPERVRHTVDGLALTSDLAPGQCCSMHWDWVCDRLDPGRLEALRTYTYRQLQLVNAPASPA